MDIKELTARLREAAADARDLDTINTELFVQMLQQLLNSYESTKTNARKEIESLQRKVGQFEGHIKAASQHQDLLIATLEAYNNQERKNREEQKRFEAEQAEKLAAQKAAKEAEEAAAKPLKPGRKKAISLKRGKKGADKAD